MVEEITDSSKNGQKTSWKVDILLQSHSSLTCQWILGRVLLTVFSMLTPTISPCFKWQRLSHASFSVVLWSTLEVGLGRGQPHLQSTTRTSFGFSSPSASLDTLLFANVRCGSAGPQRCCLRSHSQLLTRQSFCLWAADHALVYSLLESGHCINQEMGPNPL